MFVICGFPFLLLSIYELDCKEKKFSFLYAIVNNLRSNSSVLKNFPIILCAIRYIYVLALKKQFCFLLQLVYPAFPFRRKGYYHLCYLVSDR